MSFRISVNFRSVFWCIISFQAPNLDWRYGVSWSGWLKHDKRVKEKSLFQSSYFLFSDLDTGSLVAVGIVCFIVFVVIIVAVVIFLMKKQKASGRIVKPSTTTTSRDLNSLSVIEWHVFCTKDNFNLFLIVCKLSFTQSMHDKWYIVLSKFD